VNPLESPEPVPSRLHEAGSKEDIIGGPGKTTSGKRDRERARQQKQREKEARRAQRQANKLNPRSTVEGEDPDLAGLRWGPQPPLY
jgi:hypothetical protein